MIDQTYPERSLLLTANKYKLCWLACGFGIAIGLRLSVGGVGASKSTAAGLAFAACLMILGWAAGTKTVVSRRAVGLGLVGALPICLSVVVTRLGILGAHRPVGSYFMWAAVVTVVALAEEFFLRGALLEAAAKLWGNYWGAGFSAIAFALLHVPLYGWHTIPLNLAVGVWLGLIRVWSGTWTAPAVTHVTSDLAAWWML